MQKGLERHRAGDLAHDMQHQTGREASFLRLGRWHEAVTESLSKSEEVMPLSSSAHLGRSRRSQHGFLQTQVACVQWQCT